jgi:NAD(P)-dependent dehydrogenase (short-subunit alcohol dehydrogenase family)
MQKNTFIHYPIEANCLANKVILVTGSGSGIGCAVAVTAARYGATVILMGRTLKKLSAVYDYIIELGYPEPVLYPLDFLKTSPENLLECAQAIWEQFGRLDGLVHNAAMLGPLSPVEHYPADMWLKVMQVNLNVPFLLSQKLIPLLKLSSHGRIVFTTGTLAQQAKPYWGAFTASKFGLHSLSQVLAEELESNTSIRVNSIDPGPVRSALRATAFPAGMEQILACPEEITAPYIYLLSDASQEVKGQVLKAQKENETALDRAAYMI